MANLLMIDDNPQNQTYLSRIIRLRTDHEFVVAGSGPEGIEKIVDQRPDLIFLDLFIPGIDGFELSSSCATTQRLILSPSSSTLQCRWMT